MKIIKAPTVKCKRCQTINTTAIDDFQEPNTESNERNMGYETGYSWTLEITCTKCENELEIIVEAWEYPIGILNYTEFETVGCSFVEEPVVEVEFDNEQYDLE